MLCGGDREKYKVISIHEILFSLLDNTGVFEINFVVLCKSLDLLLNLRRIQSVLPTVGSSC